MQSFDIKSQPAIRKTPKRSPKGKHPSAVIVISDTSEDDDFNPLKVPKQRRVAQSADCSESKSMTSPPADTVMTASPKRIKEVKRNLFIGQNDMGLPDCNSDSESSLPDPFEPTLSSTFTQSQTHLVTNMDNFDDVQNDDTLRHSPETNETNDEFATFYDEDPLLPIFKPLDKGILTKDAVELLFRTLSETQLARNIPLGIAKNSSFVYSIKTIGHWKNALCDGMGKWQQTGTGTSNIYVDGNLYVCCNSKNGEKLKVVRRKYKNGSCNSLHRIVIVLENNAGVVLDQIFMQYYFTGKEKRINILAHGNNNTSDSEYRRKSQSTKERIQELCKEKTKPKDTRYMCSLDH